MAGLTPKGSIFGNKAETDSKSFLEGDVGSSPLCPQCRSKRVWRDGKRYTPIGYEIQRCSCRDCGLRFSDPNDVQMAKRAARAIETVDSKSLKRSDDIVATRQICVTETKNLAAEPQTTEVLRRNRVLSTTTSNFEGEIVEFLWWMQKQGYQETTIAGRDKKLRRLAQLGADLNNPESVKETIARQQKWKESMKESIVFAYDLYAKWKGLTWQKPRYKSVRQLPFIPQEREIDDIIAGCSKHIALFLQIGKETGARAGEIFRLEWTDIDFESRTINIIAEKGSNPRRAKMSNKLLNMLSATARTSEKIFTKHVNLKSLRRCYERQRNRTAHRLANPRIQKITFHTLRHWKATMEYAKTKDILHVMQVLGHKNIKNTLLYTQLIAVEKDDQFTCRVAKEPKEIQDLIEDGFEFVCSQEDLKFFRKRK